MLRLADVRKVYRTVAEEVHALRGVSLSVRRGEFIAVIGPSGSGKSTLLNLLGCLDTPTSGEYHFEGQAVHTLGDEGLARVRNSQIGFVFQSFNLLPRISARKNVEMPLIYAGVPRAERRRRAEEALAKVRLSHRVTHRPSELSGGEKQRVAIARALVTQPSILLADEPTGNLDTKVGGEIIGLLEELNRGGATILLITHDLQIAARCRRTIEIRDGSIVRDSAA
ncbi:MAG: ABC transporter ATP-binding protein [Planctomycetes bacterium]|nr:ABC transporter ATP-binding protein [Planctomycetota bacterium]